MVAAKTSTTLAALAAALAATTAEGAPGAAPSCPAMLGDIAALGHSDLELAAYCHASLPPQLCRDGLAGLGPQPWSAEGIAATCKSFEDSLAGGQQTAVAPARAAQDMNFEDLTRKVDECMAAKAHAGLCKDQGRPMEIDQCIRWKQDTYPKKTAEIQEVMARFYGLAMGQKSEQLGPIDAAPRRLGVGLIAGLASVGGSAAAVLAIAYHRLRRTQGARHLLVADGGEQSDA